ncbi:response regulator [bacterium]|nr:response regulator [bacterium]
MPNIDLDEEFLKLLYGATNSEMPADINLAGLKNQLIKINDLIKELNSNSFKKPAVVKNNAEDDEEEQKGPAILVVDDLGVITYQLKVLLSRFEYDVDCSQEIYDAVNKFKKRKYIYVVMDLFIPTEREGFILLTELRKMAIAAGIRTVIGVITASPRKEIEQQCKARGADFFLEKSSDWQNNLLEIMNSYINAGKEEEEEF